MRKYLVMAMRTPRFDDSVIVPHKEWLADVRERGQLVESGKFTDSSGGAYVITAENLAAATELIHTDPIHLTGASELTIYEWEITG
ncbi:YciI family protein [Nocardia sp. CDC153]|uniref:YciI family protein n=1 Tax=unclassified Nocardia TaxID=2637762 RepID=UPI002DB6D286|nr:MULTISPECIES: YciI family protein [unclassified Nocardia]MEC3918167.1 YciI family protein [Nocardia sp. CDC160]MEC3953463.1 YciI family protein [Nocardia sp. CDC153]